MSLGVWQKATSAVCKPYLHTCATHVFPSKRKVVALHVHDYRNPLSYVQYL